MKNEITIYELLGLIKDNPNKNIYVKYFSRFIEKEDIMWACLENLFDKLDNKIIFLNDKVEILEEDKSIIEKIEIEEDIVCNKFVKNEYGAKCYIKTHDKIVIEKLNQVIDYINRKEDK